MILTMNDILIWGQDGRQSINGHPVCRSARLSVGWSAHPSSRPLAIFSLNLLVNDWFQSELQYTAALERYILYWVIQQYKMYLGCNLGVNDTKCNLGVMIYLIVLYCLVLSMNCESSNFLFSFFSFWLFTFPYGFWFNVKRIDWFMNKWSLVPFVSFYLIVTLYNTSPLVQESSSSDDIIPVYIVFFRFWLHLSHGMTNPCLEFWRVLITD